MSLIADALRKAETPAGLPPPEQPPEGRSLWKFRLLLLVLTGGVLIGLGVLTHRRNLPPTGQALTLSTGTRPAILPSALPSRGAELQGIIYGKDGSSLAIIGTRIVSEGDLVGEARVARISSTEVELVQGKNTTTLRLSK